MKKLVSLLLAALLVLSVASCALAEEKKTVVIGATPSPHQEVLELIKDDMAALGYDLEIITFTEYPLPNPALADKQLDANYFQLLPYLNAYNATVSDDEKLVPVIGVHYEPYGIYAGKTKTLEDLADGAVVAVTNDPSNETRALLLLQEAGIIKLPEDATVNSSLTAFDVVENPLKINLLEIDASQLPSTLQDVDMAVINGNFALDAGLSPAKDAIFMEAADSEAGEVYTNYVVVRPEDKDAAWVEALRSCLQSQKIYDFILNNEDYKGGVIPAFTVEEKAEYSPRIPKARLYSRAFLCASRRVTG